MNSFVPTTVRFLLEILVALDQLVFLPRRHDHYYGKSFRTD